MIDPPEFLTGPSHPDRPKNRKKMNNTVNVNIAGVAFVLDAKGYALLKDYLVRIEVGYKDNPDGNEILSDIEARISELILNEQNTEKIVPTELIRNIIGQLGYPDGIDSESPTEEAGLAESATEDRIPKRLYRNPDGARLCGVCNGLATYFDIEPTIVRLLFCSPLLICICISVIPIVNTLCGFFGTLIGVSFLLYLILWFAIPKARTPRQRLEMTGEKITASTIRRNISRDLDDVQPSPHNERSASVFSELLFVVGRILLFCIKVFALVIGVALTIGSIGMIAGVIALLAGGEIFGGIHFNGMILPAILCLLLFVLPVAILVYLLIRSVFNLPRRKTTLSVLFGIWILILIYLGIYFVRNYDRFENFIRFHDIESTGIFLHRSHKNIPSALFSDYDDEDLIEERHVTLGETAADTLCVRTVWLDESNRDTVRTETIDYIDSTRRDTTTVEYFVK